MIPRRTGIRAAPRTGGVGDSGSFTAPPMILRGQTVVRRLLHSVREWYWQKVFAEPKKAKWDVGNKRKGRWRAARAQRTPGCSWGFARGEPQVPAKWRSWCRNVGRIPCVLVSETAWVLGGHMADKLSSGRSHIHLGFSQEQTQTGVWPTGLLVATQPCLLLRRRGASPRAFSIPPSPTFPPTGRILETWEHTDFHSHIYMHTQTHMLRSLVRLPVLHSMSQLVDLVSAKKPACLEGR